MNDKGGLKREGISGVPVSWFFSCFFFLKRVCIFLIDGGILGLRTLSKNIGEMTLLK